MSVLYRYILLAVCIIALHPAALCDARRKGEGYRGVYLDDGRVPSRYLMVGHGEYTIYLPADYRTSGKKYPVLYLLHGMVEDHTSWARKGDVVRIVDNAVKKGMIKPFVIVMPNGYNSFYLDDFFVFDGMPGHKYESFFFKELMPFISKHYPVMKDRAHTAIAGVSMGGYGASRYAFRYPRRFCMCYSISGATNGLDKFVLECGKSGYRGFPKYFMDCGEDDAVCGIFNDRTHAFLVDAGFPHTFRKYPGGHTWDYWKGSLERMLPDLAVFFNR